MSLTDARVLVAGAGLAGLTAARDLVKMGADVVVVEARDRVGGRVLTAREGFTGGQHAEAGADMIDGSHSQLCRLVADLGLKLTPILRSGFGYARPDGKGRMRIVRRSRASGWDRLSERLADVIARYQLAEKRWDTPITAAIARKSFAQWMDETGADEELRTTATALRGFFLADPEELSLIAVVDQFAETDSPAPGSMFRVRGGNDQIAAALAKTLGERIRLETEVLAVSHRGREVRVSTRHRRQTTQMTADYVILAVPATLLRRIPITPPLPPPQHEAIGSLKYGHVTKTLLQFADRFWRAPGRPYALGSSLPIGALWDGNEEQRGRAGILSLMAGGSASDATQQLVQRDGMAAIARSLEWLGATRSELLASRQVVWETDPWSRGGYAYFDPAFDPECREWLARPFGPLFFAGEHTSVPWQGYMNGAVESGRRAAAEVAASHELRGSR